MFRLYFCLLLSFTLALTACAAPNDQAATVSADDPAPFSWEQVIAHARETRVNFFLWGGDERINRYIGELVAPRLARRYAIELVQTPLGDTEEAVSKVLGERMAGKLSGGSIDLLWINGENFRTLRQGNLLYGPWARRLPNAELIAWDEPSVANDFGYPVEGYEAPWGRAQFVMIYDSARVSDPPRSFAELLAWARSHPGRFTYPAPPDFTGSAFIRHAFYDLGPGYQALLGPFDPQLYAQRAFAAWSYFNTLKPLQWRGGQTFPHSVDQLNRLFANGEIDFSMSYNPAFASGAIEKGLFPPTTRTYLFDIGSIANTHYLAIPFNAANKAGAMVVANYLESPEAQIEKARPDVWGDLPVIDLPALSAAEAALDAVPRGAATLPLDVLAANALPELRAQWLERIERDWQEQVLKRP